MNFGTGSKAKRTKARLDAFMRKSILKLARLISRGWAIRSPVMTEIFVLSEDRTVPSRVAPTGIFVYQVIRNYIDEGSLQVAYLHIPGRITRQPFSIDTHKLLGCLEKPKRH
jgi:hypothetical protein